MENFKRVFHTILKHDKSLFFLFLLYTLISSIVPFIPIFSIKFIIDIAEKNLDINTSIYKILILTGISLFVLLIHKILSVVCDNKFLKVKVIFEKDLYKKMMQIKYEKLDTPQTQDLFFKANKAIQTQQYGFEAYIRNLFSIISKIITFLGLIVILIMFDYFILLYLLLTTIILFYISLHISKKNNDLWNKNASLSREKEYYFNVSVDFNYGKDLLFYNFGSLFMKKISFLSKEIRNNNNKIEKKLLVYDLLVFIVQLFRDVLIYLFLIINLYKSLISVSDFSLLLNSSLSFSVWLLSCINCIIAIKNQKIYIDDYFFFIDEKNDNKLGNIKIKQIETIEFKDVCFHYPNNNLMVLNHLDLKLIKGKKYGLVGINGSGKTTLIKLLLNFYQPTSGEILINGINLNSIDMDNYYDLISSMFQEINLFNLPIKNNVSLDENPCEKKVWEVLNKVGLDEKIKQYPNNINTDYSKYFNENGIELSGGEIQKLLIARCLYKTQANLIIFDEPTSAIDPIAEKEIYDLLNKLINNNSILITISHRMASMQSCDYIYVLENGRTLEQGDFSTLIKQGKTFNHLYNMQKQYYQKKEMI